MIGWFPLPFPDETFDSLCYRYAAQMKYPYKHAIGEELFGKRLTGVAVDMPHSLAYFTEHLPPGSPLTAAQIIAEHSFLPYYQPFLRGATYAQAVAQMRGGKGERNVLAALSKFRKHVPVYLRYCPVCVVNDRQYVGETYWHRQHQLPGIHICPLHAVWLEVSPVYAKHHTFSQGPVTAEAAVGQAALKPCRIEASTTAQRLLRLSQNSAWLLTRTAPLDAETLFRKYQYLLHNQGYLTTKGIMFRTLFLKGFEAYYPESLLRRLECELPKLPIQRLDWVGRLASPSPQNQFSPLHHLLLIQFLADTIGSFFAVPDDWQPFGEAPWPCLNRTCPQYRQFVITDCRSYSVTGRPRAEFQCPCCGFTYRRWGPDQTAADRYAYDWVVTYGKVWDAKLRELWNNPDITTSAMREILGLGGSDTLKCHALRLGLKFQDHRDLVLSEYLRRPLDQVIYQDRRQRRLVRERQHVLDLLRDNPNLTRKQAVAMAPAMLKDLRRFDPDWLNSQLPPTRGVSPWQVNWSERDQMLAGRIPALVLAIKAAPGKPIRITPREIARRLQVMNLLPNQLPKLPATKATLDQTIESREDFAIRRVQWARDDFIQKQAIPSRSALVRKAGAENSLSPRVTEVVDTCLAEIKASVGA